MPWANARVAHLLSVWRAAATIADDQATEESDLDMYDEAVITKNMETGCFFLLCYTHEGGECLHGGLY